jgi:hypothetical protein
MPRMTEKWKTGQDLSAPLHIHVEEKASTAFRTYNLCIAKLKYSPTKKDMKTRGASMCYIRKRRIHN